MATAKQNFVDQAIRTIAEDLRAVLVKIDDADIEWDSGMNAVFDNDATAYVDGRADEGLRQMVESDIHQFIGVMTAIRAAGNNQIIKKPTVRPLSVTTS